MDNYIKLETISLKNHPEYNEKWVQQKIEDDPSLLGLGDLTVRQSEKVQHTGGRLDILLQDELDTRYTVELQLGKTDETHIIRTIEYWDNERKRNQNYKYIAVIIAEEITNRFFNVISLFNGSIPIIAIQLKAIKYKNEIGLDFTTVLDLITPTDEDEDVEESADRTYWENRANKETVKMTDTLLSFVNEFTNGFSLKYNKHYIGLMQNEVARNFAYFCPRKSIVQLNLKMSKNDEVDEIINNSDLDLISYQPKRYRLRLQQNDLLNNEDVIIELLKRAYESFTGNKIIEQQDNN